MIASWSSDNLFVAGAESLRFNLGPIKSGTVLPTARHYRDISLKRVVLPAGAMTRRWAPQTRRSLRRNTANIMKDLIHCFQMDTGERWSELSTCIST